MDIFGYMSTEEAGADGHAAADHTSAQLSRAKHIRFRYYLCRKVDLPEYIGWDRQPHIIRRRAFSPNEHFNAECEIGERARNGPGRSSVYMYSTQRSSFAHNIPIMNTELTPIFRPNEKCSWNIICTGTRSR